MVYVQRMYMHVCMWVREGRERGEPTITLPCLPPDQVASFCVLNTYIYRIVLHYVLRTTHSLNSSIQTTLRLYSVQVPTIHMSDSCAPVPFFTHSLFPVCIHTQTSLLSSVHVLNLHANTHTLSLPPSPPSFLLFPDTGADFTALGSRHRNKESRIGSNRKLHIPLSLSWMFGV